MERFTIQLPDDLVFVAKECIRRERLRSMSELFGNFLQHWGVTQHPFYLTGEWPALDASERDALNAGIRVLVESGEGQRGSWLKNEIRRCVQEINGEAATQPGVDQVLRKLPESVRKILSAGSSTAKKAIKMVTIFLFSFFCLFLSACEKHQAQTASLVIDEPGEIEALKSSDTLVESTASLIKTLKEGIRELEEKVNRMEPGGALEIEKIRLSEKWELLKKTRDDLKKMQR